MECRPLEITLISAKDIKDVNMFSKMDVYAEVSVHGDPYNSKQKQKTHVDKDCGTNPKWNFPMKFTIHESSAQDNRLTLHVKLVSDRSLGDREIGEVHVPIKELLHQKSADDKTDQEQSTVSYSVRTPKGKSKGTLNFSFKFGEKFEAPLVKAKKLHDPVMAFPPAGYSGAGASSAYPPHGGYQPAPHMGAHGPYPYPYPAPGGYPPHPQQAYNGYPHAAGYGYPGAPAPGYGGYQGMVQQPPKKNSGGNMALGLGAGLLGGLLIGDMISDVGEVAAYDAGYDAGFGDGFDF